MKPTPTGHPFLLLLLLPALLPAAPPVPGLARIHLLRDFRALQFSSRDPTGRGGDSGHFLETLPGGAVVLARVEGPGRVVRIWSANPTGRIQFLLDGSKKPLLEIPFHRLFDQSLPPFLAPLSCWSGGGGTCYVPIPFRKGIEIRVVPDRPGASMDFYYHVGIEKLPPGGVKESFRIPPPPSVRDEIAGLLQGAPPSARREQALSLGPAALGRLPLEIRRSGPGLIREIRLRVSRLGDPVGRPALEDLDLLTLRFWWDGAGAPSVEVPLGAFFGSAFGAPPSSTQAFRVEGKDLVCDWPMPFEKGFRMEIRNALPSGEPFLVDGRIFLAPPGRGGQGPSGRFHARWTRQRAKAGRPIRILDTKGRGRFAGLFLAARSSFPTGLTFLEGDETIRVDGEAEPSFHGTGTEDYFDGAWYFAPGPFSLPFQGVSVKTADRIAVCRLHVPDPIPFRRSFSFTLDHGERNDAPGTVYQVTSFWYSLPAAPAGSRLPAGKDRLFPAGAPLEPIEAEAVGPGGTLVEGEGSGRAFLRLEPGGSPFAFRLGRFPAGRYQLRLAARCRRRKGWSFRLPAGESRPLHPGKAFAWKTLGIFPHPGGPMILFLQAFPGAASLDADAFLVRPFLPSIRRWSVLGPFPSPERKGFERTFPPERDGYRAGRNYGEILGKGSRTWRIVDCLDSPSGYLDLNRFFDPRALVVAFAACFVRSPLDQEGDLVLGSDDGVKAWWNGKLILSHKVIRGASRENERIRVHIRKGVNTLLLKVENNIGGWGLYARIEGARGLEYSPTPRKPL